jgi:mRNA interferase RelE/StbE
VPYELRYTRDAQKGLAAMPRADAGRIVQKLEDVARDPLLAHGVKKLVDREGYRLRSGDWRALFTLDHGQLIVTVIKVENRREAYR